MQDALGRVAALRRPKLLVRAARHGQGDYRRESCLARLLPASATPGPGAAVMRLLDREAELDEARRAGLASYRLVDHVEVLIALMAEADLLRQAGLRAV